MQVIDASQFVLQRFPQNLAEDAIHLWYFPQWPEPLRSVAQSPLLLRMLAAYTDCRASELSVELNEHGKPRLRNAALEFNLSHSGTALLLGLSRLQSLGVDVEARRRDRPVMQLARRWFNAVEAATLEGLPKSLQQSAFVRLWSCKEAVLKAHGRGIGYGLDHVVFNLDCAGNVAAIHGIAGEAQSAAWQVCRLVPREGVTGALAWCGPPQSVSAFVADADHIDSDHIRNLAAGL